MAGWPVPDSPPSQLSPYLGCQPLSIPRPARNYRVGSRPWWAVVGKPYRLPPLPGLRARFRWTGGVPVSPTGLLALKSGFLTNAGSLSVVSLPLSQNDNAQDVRPSASVQTPRTCLTANEGPAPSTFSPQSLHYASPEISNSLLSLRSSWLTTPSTRPKPPRAPRGAPIRAPCLPYPPTASRYRRRRCSRGRWRSFA